MYLSQETVAILKNFASINQSVLIKPGKQLRSMSVMKNILVEAEVTEEFTDEIGIYDLNQFLNCLSLIPGAELTQKDGTLVISDNRTALTIVCDGVITALPIKNSTCQ